MEEKYNGPSREAPGYESSGSSRDSSGPSGQSGEPRSGASGESVHRDRKDFDDRLNNYADRLSRAVSDGVRKLEDAFDKGKANLKEDLEAKDEGRRLSGSPRLGLILLVVGFFWLLHSLGVLNQPIFPILVIILGIYFLLRSR